MAIQVQIQALIAKEAGVREERGTSERYNTESNIKVAKPPVFNGEAGKVGDLSWHANYI